MASSSDAAPRAALVLYGRVGTYLVRTQSLKMGQHGDPELWARAAASIKQHVVDPWRRAGGVDVFVQSWNPELTAQMREFWQPAAVDHAEQVDDGSMIPRHCMMQRSIAIIVSGRNVGSFAKQYVHDTAMTIMRRVMESREAVIVCS